MTKVVAVVVTYQPGGSTQDALRELAPQAAVLVVDNGSSTAQFAAMRSKCPPGIEWIELGANRGIGAAHNAGIARAKALGATHVLLMDQDSVPEPDMVARLLEGEAKLLARGEKVGAVGPVYHDPRVGKSWPFYRMSSFGVRGHACGGEDAVPCDFLISSGTLVRMSVLDEVGGMNAAYFLEHVDTEWSLRAGGRGYRLFGICAARMTHSLGDDAIAIPLTGQRVQIYQPYRYYYLFRNSMLLWRERHAVLPWKVNEVKRLLKRMVFFPLMVAPRMERLRYMLLGLWHGLLGRDGPLQP